MKVLQMGMGWLSEQAGGLNRMFHGLVHHLPASGVEVKGLVAGSADISRQTNGIIEGFSSSDSLLPGRLLAARSAYSTIQKSWQPDMTATHFALYAYPLSGLSAQPHVVHFHGPWSSESAVESHSLLGHMLKRHIERSVYAKADRFIVLSEAFKSVLVQEFRADPHRIDIVPGGVDTDAFSPDETRTEARKILDLPSDRPIVVTVRRLARRMGLTELVESVSLMRERVPEVLIVVVGKGPLGSELAIMVRDLGLEANVRLTGFVSEEQLPLYYRSADLAVMPTQALEGFGLTAVEALAAGTPVVVTPVGGLPEVVDGLSENLVCADRTSGAIADRLGDLLTGKLKVPDAEECAAFVQSRYSWPVISNKTADVYRKCL